MLRTRGVSFIMISLAFAQMFYFVMVSLKQYGGDEGLTINQASQFGPLTLGNPYVLYGATFAAVVLASFACHRVVNAPFGLILRACMYNEERMKALGYPTLRYKLTAYVLSAIVAGVAGLFLANLTLFASPSYGSWTISGELMLMVVLGGAGTVVGPTLGAFALLLLEDTLKRATGHWMGIFGVIIICIGVAARQGIWGWFNGRD
jgi:branched-chain amino acid transport system permease protein